MYRLMMIMGAVAAICFATGCGSSGDEEATAAPLTKAQFIKRADQICETARKQRAAALAKLSKDSAAKESEAAQKVIAPSLALKARELRDLEVPQSERVRLVSLASELSTMSRAFAEGGSSVKTAIAVLPRYERDAIALDLKKCRLP
jgi:hypothetical protein